MAAHPFWSHNCWLRSYPALDFYPFIYFFRLRLSEDTLAWHFPHFPSAYSVLALFLRVYCGEIPVGYNPDRYPYSLETVL